MCNTNNRIVIVIIQLKEYVMKKYIFFSAVIALSVHGLRADLAGIFEKVKKTGAEIQKKDVGAAFEGAKGIFSDVAPLLRKAKVYPDTTKTSVEILNKGGEIYVSFTSGGTVVKEGDESVFMIPPAKTRPFSMDINQATEIRIWKSKPTSPEATTDLRYTTPPGKTVYVTWRDNKLRPQTGPGKGKLGKTNTGLSLGKNVKPDDVKKI